MGISVGIFLFAVGAILRYAVNTSVDGINLQMVGVILMIVGVAGSAVSALFWSSFAPYGRDRRSDVVRETEIVRERDLV
ncbi:MAG: DUF6458 family protein [Acidimicrobiia bacterium]